MIRARFTVAVEGGDYRPLQWPIKYPYWCSGYKLTGTVDEPQVGAAILIAFADQVEDITALWPEAADIEASEVAGVTFSERFPKPDWYNG